MCAPLQLTPEDVRTRLSDAVAALKDPKHVPTKVVILLWHISHELPDDASHILIIVPRQWDGTATRVASALRTSCPTRKVFEVTTASKKERGSKQDINEWREQRDGILVCDFSEGYNLQQASVVYVLSPDPKPSADEQVGMTVFQCS